MTIIDQVRKAIGDAGTVRFDGNDNSGAYRLRGATVLLRRTRDGYRVAQVPRSRNHRPGQSIPDGTVLLPAVFDRDEVAHAVADLLKNPI